MIGFLAADAGLGAYGFVDVLAKLFASGIFVVCLWRNQIRLQSFGAGLPSLGIRTVDSQLRPHWPGIFDVQRRPIRLFGVGF